MSDEPAFPGETVTRHIGAPGMTVAQYAAIHFMAGHIAYSGFTMPPAQMAENARRYAAALLDRGVV